MIYIRSLLFFVVFIGALVPLMLFLSLFLVLPVKYCRWIASFWSLSFLCVLKWTLCLKYELIGKKYLSKTPVFYACKHQSTWETFALSYLLENPCLVLKKELLNTPPFCFLFRRFEMITVDRTGGIKSMKSLLAQTKHTLEKHESIAIYPEGTRRSPGEEPDYKPGLFFLYNQCEIPVVPIALNSGCFWGKRKFLKHPGKITIELLPPIPPGLDKKTFMAALQDAIESKSNALADDAYMYQLNRKEGQ